MKELVLISCPNVRTVKVRGNPPGRLIGFRIQYRALHGIKFEFANFI